MSQNIVIINPKTFLLSTLFVVFFIYLTIIIILNARTVFPNTLKNFMML